MTETEESVIGTTKANKSITFLNRELERAKNEIDYWKIKLGEQASAANRAQQEINFLRNAYNDFGNQVKGVKKFAPDSFRNGMGIFMYGWKQVKTIDGAYSLFTKGSGIKFWQVIAASIIVMVSISFLFTPAGPELGKALIVPTNQAFILIFLFLMLIALIIISRRKNTMRPQA